MTRRDLIIVAVLANIGVLAILFMLAFRTEEEQPVNENSHIAYHMTEETVHVTPTEISTETATKQPEPVDMIDAALDEETLTSNVITGDDEHFQIIETETPKEEKIEEPEQPATEQKFVEVTVKRGDALEKIARSNGTTVEEIMKANDLKNDRLKIGQVLKVPVGTRKKSAPAVVEKPKVETKTGPEYYTVKSGDNPWKIAKQFHLKLDELLKLNNLNEEKARNLKVGDTIRVK